MEKSYIKCFFFITLFMFLKINRVMNGGNSQEGTSSSGKALPLILMKESNVLEIPNDVSMRSWFFSLWKTRNFHANTGLNERFFCAADSGDQKKIRNARKKVSNTEPLDYLYLISENCLFEKPILRWTKNFNLEISCTNEPEPFISPLGEPKKKNPEGNDDLNNLHFIWPSCGPGQNKKLYRFGYQLWLESDLYAETKLVPPLIKSMAHPYKNSVDYEIYRFCYDSSTQEILYTKHTILSPALLFNENLKEESKTYSIEISNYGNSELNFTKNKMIYDQLNDSNVQNIPITDQDTENISKKPNLMEYKIEKLIPDEDFAFILWKKPTFHHVNQHLMHKALIKPWKEINKLIRDKAIFPPTEFDIYTGTFDISTKAKKKKTLETTEEIRIPEIWVKIVQLYYRNDELEVEQNQAVAIIANNHMDLDLEKTISKYCNYTNMYQYYSEEDRNLEKKEYSYIRFCSVTSNIEELFGLDLKIKDTLGLIRLTAQNTIYHEEETL